MRSESPTDNIVDFRFIRVREAPYSRGRLLHNSLHGTGQRHEHKQPISIEQTPYPMQSMMAMLRNAF